MYIKLSNIKYVFNTKFLKPGSCSLMTVQKQSQKIFMGGSIRDRYKNKDKVTNRNQF